MAPRTILIDGRAGAGKTTLAEALVELCPQFQVVHLDDVYPGWSGLAAARETLAKDILALEEPHYRRWDWHQNTYAETVRLDPTRDLLVEGVGALSPGSIAAARRRSADKVLTIEVTAPDDLRHRRAMKRDPYFAEHWQDWAAQEREHRALMPEVDLIIDNSSPGWIT